MMTMIRRCSWLIMLMMLVGCTGTQTSSPESDLPAVGDRPASEENETSTAGEQTAVPQEEWIMDVPDLTSLDSITLIVNKQHGLPEDYEPQDLVTPEVTLAKSSITLRAQAAEAIRVMFDAAAEEGISLMIGSGYRSYEYQKNLYNNYVERDGERQASRYSAKPGMSEHQTGLAVDLSGSNGECYLKECFKETEEGFWLKDNAWKYGFILRYPEGKEDITGYIFEPWHYRYFGIEEAAKIQESGLTVEEYYGLQTDGEGE